MSDIKWNKYPEVTPKDDAYYLIVLNDKVTVSEWVRERFVAINTCCKFKNVTEWAELPEYCEE